MNGSSEESLARNVSLEEIQDLPTLPTVAAQALAVADDPSSSARDLLEVIMSDPPTAARVLKVANSSYFRRGGEVTDLQTAIVRLGFSMVRSIVLAVSVVNTMDPFFSATRYSREDFWLHCSAVAALSKHFAERRPGRPAATAFVAGLLHDIGKIVLDRHVPKPFEQALASAQKEAIPLPEAEVRVMRTHHAAIGGELLRLWDFPAELIAPIRWHHDPDLCHEKHRPLAAIVGAADYYCNVEGVGYGGNPCPVAPPPSFLRELQVDESSLQTILAAVAGNPLSRVLL